MPLSIDLKKQLIAAVIDDGMSKTEAAKACSVGCRVIFLPPYSPDFNPIEHFWAAVKNKFLCKIEGNMTCLKETHFAFRNFNEE